MKTFNKFVILLVLSQIIFFQNTFSYEKIKIGLIVPLSGEHANLGNSIIKAIRMGVNKIDDKRFEIIIKDTRSNPIGSLRVSKELYNDGVRIIIGPVFNENTKYLDELKDVTFISLTNKVYGNPTNVISAGVNAISQIKTIKKFNKKNNIERSIFLIPKTDYKKEINLAIKKTNIKHKDKFFYDTNPTLLTSQIEEITKYRQRKQNLKNEIKRLENSLISNKEKKIENLKKKDTLGGINFDSVIIADFDESLKSVANSLLYTDVSSKRISYIALNQWFDNTLLKETSLQPIYFPSINKQNYDLFIKEYTNLYKSKPNQLSFLSYDIVGLVYYLIYKNNYKINNNIFYEKNKFKGKIGIFEINKNVITHQLNLYSIEDSKFKKIF